MKQRKRYLFGSAIAMVLSCGLFFFSCEKDEVLPNAYTPQAEMQENNNPFKGENEEKGIITELRDNCGQMVQRALITSNGAYVGKAVIYNDLENFHIKLIAGRDLAFGRAFAHIAYDKLKFPLDKRGNLWYEKFDYRNDNAKPKREVYFKIPYENIALKQFLSSVMCEVYSFPNRPGPKQHAWIEGRPYGDSVEGRIFAYTTKPCRVIDGGFDDDTADN
jgi:hypothetical protein